MKIIVINSGSSSIKFQLFDMTDESVIAKGIIERVGTPEVVLHLTINSHEHPEVVMGSDSVGDHRAGVMTILAALVENKAIESVAEIDGIGHRVVHGGELIRESRIIEQDVLKAIRDNSNLAPLHNPPNLSGIEAAREAMPDAPHVAVFDTAFFASLPPNAYRYAVPEQWYTQYHVRRYGFHGISHRYVMLRAAELLGKSPDEVNLITVHLGNGCSMTAIEGGKAVDHSMGMTPLEGLVMGTRCGDIDPGVIIHLNASGISCEQIDKIMNTESGLLGVSGLSNDMRDLLDATEQGDKKAELAIEMFVYRIVKYIGAYYTILSHLDAIVLTGGIGENSYPVRSRICNRLGRLGVVCDARRNEHTIGGASGPITTDDSPLGVWVVATNEELMIARDTKALLERR